MATNHRSDVFSASAPTGDGGSGRRRALERVATPGALWCALLGLTLLALAACGGTHSTFGRGLPRVEATPEIAELERAMHARVNADRQAQGLPPLELDERLSDIARTHSQDMKQVGFFAHDSPTTGSLEDRLDAAGYLALEARENLASATSIDQAQQNLLASEGHRANLFSDRVTHIGIGIVHGDRTGDARMLTVTQVFATPGETQSAEVVLAAVTQALHDARRKAGRPPLEPHDALDDLARQHVDELPPDLGGDALGRIGDDIAEELSEQAGHGLKGVELDAQVLFTAAQFEAPPAALSPTAGHLGLAATEDHDERGRAQTKILILIGR